MVTIPAAELHAVVYAIFHAAGAAPAVALVVVGLRAGPEYVQVHQVDLAKALFGDSTL